MGLLGNIVGAIGKVAGVVPGVGGIVSTGLNTLGGLLNSTGGDAAARAGGAVMSAAAMAKARQQQIDALKQAIAMRTGAMGEARNMFAPSMALGNQGMSRLSSLLGQQPQGATMTPFHTFTSTNPFGTSNGGTPMGGGPAPILPEKPGGMDPNVAGAIARMQGGSGGAPSPASPAPMTLAQLLQSGGSGGLLAALKARMAGGGQTSLNVPQTWSFLRGAGATR